MQSAQRSESEGDLEVVLERQLARVTRVNMPELEAQSLEVSRAANLT